MSIGARDYASEMRTVIDKATDEPGYVAPLVAVRVVAELREHDPELLDGWLHAQAEAFVCQAIGARDRSIRAHARHEASGARFQEASKRYEAGDAAAFQYLSIPFTLADKSRKPLGQLTHDDLLFIRDDYQRRVDDNNFYVALAKALAKRVKTGVVEDYYTEDQIAAMFGSKAA